MRAEMWPPIRRTRMYDERQHSSLPPEVDEKFRRAGSKKLARFASMRDSHYRYRPRRRVHRGAHCMPRVVVERHEGSLIDRYRPYIIFIDGQERGAVRNCETWQCDVPAGSHTVTLHVGHY